MNTHLKQRNKHKAIMVEETEKENFLIESRQKCEKETQWREVRGKRDMKKQYGNIAFYYKFQIYQLCAATDMIQYQKFLPALRQLTVMDKMVM